MRTLIAATHSRPAQYSQNHAYRQEAPTRLSHSFLAEGPRASRALSASRASSSPNSTGSSPAWPHPVADGHLVDVAALAAPPCELAAYGLHAGGLQALAHTRVPHRRYDGMLAARSLKPRSSLRFLQYGQLSSMRMERMLTFSRQTWPHDPRHHTMVSEWAWGSSAHRPPFSSGSSCLATSGLFDPRSLLPLAR